MDITKIPFGYHSESDRFVDVHTVERGLACDCVCPSCKTPLMAKMGNEKVWHFAHASRGVYEKTESKCEYAFFLSVRMMARQLIDHEIKALIADPSTHYWAKDVLTGILTKDPDDMAMFLSKLSQLADDRQDAIYEQNI